VEPASLSTTAVKADPGVEVLSEERVRDQLSAAEELLFVGHREPALVAAGAALEGALRLRACRAAGSMASAPALLEALLAMDAVADDEYDLLLAALKARDCLIRGYLPVDASAADRERIACVAAIVVRLLEEVREGSADRYASRR
jgi:hypothetical protein